MDGPVGGGAYPPLIPRALWIHCSDLSVVALSEIGPVGGPAFVRAGGDACGQVLLRKDPAHPVRADLHYHVRFLKLYINVFFCDLYHFVFARHAMVGLVGGGAYPPTISRALWI